MTKSPIVLAFGGGQDGTAMLIEMAQRGMRPDLIQFADTGNRDAEKPETYAHVDRMDAWCREKWGLGIVWVRNDGMYGTLEADCLAHKRLPSIAYGFKSCSEKYKLRPQLKNLRAWQPAVDCWNAGGQVTRFVGFNADEWHRVKSFDDPRFIVRYPLVEWGITRRMVREIVQSELGYIPLKSACKFCPSSKKSEVVWLKDIHPKEFSDCIAMERAAIEAARDGYGAKVDCALCSSREVPDPACMACGGKGFEIEPTAGTVRGLGRHWSWEEIAEADERQFKMFPEAPEMPCMCFDGSDA